MADVDARDRDDIDEQPPGGSIVNVAWAGTAIFAVAAVGAAIAPDSLGVPFAALSGVLFVAGCVAFLWAYGRAVARSRTEQLGIAGIYFLSGSAPRVVQFRLLMALAVEVVAAVAAASIRPYTSVAFGVLGPMWGLGLAGTWGARHGVFPAREHKIGES